MNDQIVELSSPGLSILVYSPAALDDLKPGRNYVPWLPDGRDVVDHVNDCRLAAFGVRWPTLDYWLHFSSTLDHGVIARASDHVRMGIEVTGGQLCVRGGDDLFKWTTGCPRDQLVSIADGSYEVTACMVPYDGSGFVQIYLHFARTRAKPDMGYAKLPELYCEAPVY